MSLDLSTAQSYAWHLAQTLMVCVTLFRADDAFGAIPSGEFEGDTNSIIHEYDPFAV